MYAQLCGLRGDGDGLGTEDGGRRTEAPFFSSWDGRGGGGGGGSDTEQRKEEEEGKCDGDLEEEEEEKSGRKDTQLPDRQTRWANEGGAW